MKRNDILKVKEDVFRVLDVEGDNVCFIDCHKKTMPKTEHQSFFDNAELLDSFTQIILHGKICPLLIEK
jgi:hypothetical protein